MKWVKSKFKNLSTYMFINYSLMFIFLVIVIYINQYMINTELDEISGFNSKTITAIEENDKAEDIYKALELREGSFVQLLDDELKVIEEYNSPLDVGNLYKYNEFVNKTIENPFQFQSIMVTEPILTESMIVIYDTSLPASFDEFLVLSNKIKLRANLITLISIIVVFLIFSDISISRIIQPIQVIIKRVDEIADGEYNNKLEIQPHNELMTLVKGINTMSTKLQKEIENRELLEKDKRRMIMDISHDLRTPLTNIAGYSELLRENVSCENKKYIDVIISNSKTSNAIIENLFEISKIEDNSIELNLEETEINEYMREIIIEYLPEFETKKIDYEINLVDDKLYMNIDRVKFKRALSNFINNSMKYGGDNLKILFKTYKENGSIVIDIKDNGQGIPKDKIKYILEPFVRLDEARSTSVKGAGLGLPLAKKIIELHECTLEIISDIDEGFQVKIKGGV
ncbi:hypothetical protein SH2C18_39960 [Clostridium sediminicola]|uniref:sensor histidine kinase n=1 Tax=Clostridium sediminicola TaxID=3114879 RepID=UPI0031F27FBF